MSTNLIRLIEIISPFRIMDCTDSSMLLLVSGIWTWLDSYCRIGNLRTAALVSISLSFMCSRWSERHHACRLAWTVQVRPLNSWRSHHLTNPLPIHQHCAFRPCPPTNPNLIWSLKSLVESYCVPNFDSPSIFARILDKDKVCLGFDIFLDVCAWFTARC